MSWPVKSQRHYPCDRPLSPWGHPAAQFPTLVSHVTATGDPARHASPHAHKRGRRPTCPCPLPPPSRPAVSPSQPPWLSLWTAAEGGRGRGRLGGAVPAKTGVCSEQPSPPQSPFVPMAMARVSVPVVCQFSPVQVHESASSISHA